MDIYNDICVLFGKKVKQTRQKLSLSQEILAEESGLHRTYISDIERGGRNVSLENVAKIAYALGCTPKDLLDFSEFDISDNYEN